MKSPLAKAIAFLTGCALMGLALNSLAQVNQDYQTDFTSTTAFVGSIGVNLVQSGQSSLASVTAPTSALNGSFSVAGFNDGSSAGTYYLFPSTMGLTTALAPLSITAL